MKLPTATYEATAPPVGVDPVKYMQITVQSNAYISWKKGNTQTSAGEYYKLESYYQRVVQGDISNPPKLSTYLGRSMVYVLSKGTSE